MERGEGIEEEHMLHAGRLYSVKAQSEAAEQYRVAQWNGFPEE